MSDIDLAYIGIVTEERDALTIAEDALDALQTRLPAFSPREGSPEVALIGALASTVAQIGTDLQAVPATVVEALLRIYGLEQSQAVAALGAVTVEFDTLRTILIPAGTRFSDPVSGVVVESIADVSLVDDHTLVLEVQATDPGSGGNSLSAGIPLDIVDVIPGSVSAVLTTALTGGADAETMQSYFTRASTLFGSLTSTIMTPTQFIAAAIATPGVVRAQAINLLRWSDKATGIGGQMSVIAVWSSSPSSAQRTALESKLRDRAYVSLSTTVAHAVVGTPDPVIFKAVSIDAAVTVMASADDAQVRTSVREALAMATSALHWPFGKTILANDLIPVAAAVPGVESVVSITPASTTLSAWQLPVVTVTVS